MAESFAFFLSKETDNFMEEEQTLTITVPSQLPIGLT